MNPLINIWEKVVIMQLKNYKEVLQAVAIAGFSALATGLIGLWIKRYEKKLEKGDKPKTKKAKK